jgi:hypothetical protein
MELFPEAAASAAVASTVVASTVVASTVAASMVVAAAIDADASQQSARKKLGFRASRADRVLRTLLLHASQTFRFHWTSSAIEQGYFPRQSVRTFLYNASK